MSASQLAARARQGWIRLILAHHKLVLVLAALLTVFAVHRAAQLRLDSDLRELLPTDDLVVQRLETIEQGFGALGSVDVVIRGGTAKARHAFVDAIGETLEGHPLLTDVDSAFRTQFFVDRALYYLSDEELDELESRIDAFQHYQACTQSPDLCTAAPDEKAGPKLREFVQSKRDSARRRAGFGDYYEREGIDAAVVFLRATERSANMDFAQTITAQMREEITKIFEREGPWTGSGMHFNLVGPYVSKGTENEVVRVDIVRSALVGAAGVLFILWWIFRSTRAVLILLVPLLCGVAWSMGLTQLLLGRLNTMTSLMGTAILGMGIDSGIHLLSRARRERESCDDDREAIVAAFDALTGPLLVASCTTAGAFAAMMSSGFPAFREFGIIGGSGIALCLASMLTVFPALLCLTSIPRIKVERGSRDVSMRKTTKFMARSRLVFYLLVGISLAASLGVERLRADGFEFNGRKLQSNAVREATESDTRLITEIFGKDVHPGIRLVDSLDEVASMSAKAREGRAAHAATPEGSVIGQVFSVLDLLPDRSIDLEEREQRIAEFAEEFDDDTWDKLVGQKAPSADGKTQDDGLSRADVDQLRRMVDARAFKPEDLPPSMLRRVRTHDGKWGVFCYPNYDPGNILGGVRQLQETASYGEGDEPYVGEATVFAAMYLLLQSEWPPMLILAGSIVLLLVWLQLRSLVRTLLTVLPLAVGTWWMLGTMGAIDLKFTLLSVPIFPAILGIGVDHGVYLTTEVSRASSPEELRSAIGDTIRAIVAATATTLVAFGSFLLADSGGLRDIGSAAVIGILAASLAAITVLPTLAAFMERRDSAGSGRGL